MPTAMTDGPPRSPDSSAAALAPARPVVDSAHLPPPLVEASAEPASALGRAGTRAWNAVAVLGHPVRTALEELGGSARFTWSGARAVPDVGTWAPLVMQQARLLGVNSFPIGLLLAVFTGIVLALLASYSFTSIVPVYFVGTLLEKTVTMELAPVLTGLALAGRVGASIAAELGTMRVTEQIDALETLAYDPHAYLVVPRVLAGTVMFPMIVAAAMVVGIAAGWITSILLLDISSAQFLKGVRLFFGGFDVWYGVVKAASFGFAVTLIGCESGMTARGGAAGVGAAATRAVVNSAVMILVLDAFWAVAWLLQRTK
jgi:phospholipid/cholesterol/gamma-HCH transport system permease protein